jgi:hypothetical protein
MVPYWIECVNLGFGDEYILYGERPNGDKFKVFITGEQAAALTDLQQRQRDELQAACWQMIGEAVPA